jgi:uncharacterized membrane protein YfcA
MLLKMDLSILSDFSIFALVMVIAIAFLAGVVKGAIGFAMPLIILSGLSSIMDPKLALGATILPIVFSNVLQVFRSGTRLALDVALEYWRYILMICLGIFVAGQFVPRIPTQHFYLMMGILIVLLPLAQLLVKEFYIPEKYRVLSEWSVGAISGAIGGLAGLWGPTTVLYLLALDMPKKKQFAVLGVIFLTGSAALLTAHTQSGVLNSQTLPLSLSLLLPASLGMWLGFQLQDRLDQVIFRKLTLVLLIVAGLNLLRKAFQL